MVQEEKHTLLVDLCARLPYGVILYDEHCKKDYKLISLDVNCFINYDIANSINHIKPYLRPMSSMTDEEKEHLQSLHNIITDENYGDGYSPAAWDAISEFNDYCNVHHLDNRGLIGKGLALEAPEQMYD